MQVRYQLRHSPVQSCRRSITGTQAGAEIAPGRRSVATARGVHAVAPRAGGGRTAEAGRRPAARPEVRPRPPRPLPGSDRALCSTRRQRPSGCSSRTDQAQFTRPPSTVQCSIGRPSSAPMPERAAPPCVATTSVPPGGRCATWRRTAAETRAATSVRDSPPPGRTSSPGRPLGEQVAVGRDDLVAREALPAAGVRLAQVGVGGDRQPHDAGERLCRRRARVRGRWTRWRAGRASRGRARRARPARCRGRRGGRRSCPGTVSPHSRPCGHAATGRRAARS